MNLGIADALCRRLLPAERLTATLRLLAFDLADIYDAAVGVRDANRFSAAGDYFFFATLPLVFLTVFFAAALAFGFAFFAILPS
ncbi:MAG TPA: hypothetical protein VHI75_12425 [Casimicrobiaceae bacterium]|nr:hypothetical protein [Casimicrobiaceae bacterium]